MKQKRISLSQIGLYNPQRQSDEVVEGLFVVRKKLFEHLMERLQKEKPKSIPQHYLVIAQRGMGKTTLLKRLEVELRKAAFKESFVPLIFPEEQYNLNNLSEFWLNSLDALADTLELEGHTKLVEEMDQKIRTLGRIENKEELAQSALQYLQSLAKQLKRRPILLIDNMSFIFDRLDKADQHVLRAKLMENGAPILIGASAVAIEDAFDYGAPFYDAFQIHYLRKLSFQQLKDILFNLAKLTHSEDILPKIHQKMARLKTIHQLTGGNPRTAVMLFKLIVKGFAEEINDDLEALLDEVTPLYKARFEELSTQMQVIVDAVALHWDPINLGELRTNTRLKNNQLAPQIKRLVEVGWIEKLDAYKAKGHAYQISERFFNIWFLMRRSSRRQKKELYCLSRFLESLYGDELEGMARKRMGLQSRNIDHITYDLAIAEVIKDEEVRVALRNKSYAVLRDLAKEDPRIRERFFIPEAGEENIVEKELSFYEKRELELLEKVKQNPTYWGWFDLGYLYQVNLFQFGKAEWAYLEGIKLNGRECTVWNNLGNLYKNHLKDYERSKECYLKAIEIDEKFVYPWNGLGNLYKNHHLKDYERSKECYLKAIEIDAKPVYPWNGLGNLYQDYFKDYKKSEECYLKAIEIDEQETLMKFNLVFLYRDKLNNLDKAATLFDTIEFDESVEDSIWLHKALFELYKKNEGIATTHFEKALKIIQGGLPFQTQDDWWRFGAVVSKLGYTDWLLNIMETTGYQQILSPYYVAIRAMSEPNAEAYLNSRAVEIREPARKLMEVMERLKG